MNALLVATVITLCADSPHSGGKWIYRIIDGHKCWFEANGLRRGRERPKEELAWPSYVQPPTMEIPMPPRPPWEHEDRFRGGPEGWDHKE